jgi:4-alpha-glucanotransferase
MPARASGTLLHPTSLPGPFGAGDLGSQAARFVDSLAAAGIAVWQMLPLTAPGAYESPYDCRSAFAGNWLLISPERLVEDGWLEAVPPPPPFPADTADLPAARAYKEGVLRASWRYFEHHATPAARQELEEFHRSEAVRFWLDDWTLFSALSAHLAEPWDRWPAPLRQRERQALDQARRDLEAEIAFRGYLQFLFRRQFSALRRHARARGVRLCGDLPMYVSHQSADVWAQPDLFKLGPDRRPLAVAGVPPDAFSASGQLWGNPVYDWRRHRELGYAWWRRRLRAQAELADILRLDHFRGFAAYFEVPADAPDASAGHWERGPGRRLFAALMADLQDIELIAEDLGRITPAVRRLRREFDLPGMKVLQFAFGVIDSDHLPHHHEARSVVYTGTHDNDTLVGWFGRLDGQERELVVDYVGAASGDGPREISWHLVRLAMESVAELAVVPMQDLLALGSEARMNTPGTTYDNWRWRMPEEAFDEALSARLRRLVALTGRLPRGGPEAARD